ncbi:MAG: STAS/SEC14 domain-containing protein [Flavobacteriales bacterium]|nr:STAS/SEC14 domain-containing protein [Flavobacteriales bacterium]MCB9190396.1 STAS/SEC14 domain-containing protein [Flavobacteriales bacterium]MCB9204645.1 STAS/SEC14 domain-containing protein [Flavobacteriales bacterium]
MYKSSDLGVATVEILSGNIIHLVAKKGVVITLEDAQRLVRAIDGMLDKSNNIRAGIFEISGVVYVEEDARNYFEKGEDTTGDTVGIALVSDSFLGRTVGNMFVTMHPNTKFPVKFFDTAMRAEHWIRGLISNYNRLKNTQSNAEKRVA